MNDEAASLSQQRGALRERLRVQRELIAQRLGPVVHVPGAYPRSMTMRLLTQNPALAARLVAGIAALIHSRAE